LESDWLESGVAADIGGGNGINQRLVADNASANLPKARRIAGIHAKNRDETSRRQFVRTFFNSLLIDR
jgi:hypothetical protein